jgi:hypothetical protein
MNLHSLRAGLAALAFAGLAATSALAAEYSFTATNTSETAITKVLVSENKTDWGYFDVGAGIAPGATSNLVWDQSTNGQACTQWVKATFADGTESEPAQFDFCENGLEIDF